MMTTEQKPKIIKLADGKGYQVRLYIDRQHGYRRRVAHTRADAERIAKLMASEGATQDDRTHLGELVDAYLGDVRATKSPKTYAVKKSTLMGLVKYMGSDRKADAITVASLTRYRNHLADTMATSTIAAKLRTISAFCAWLVARNILESNPASKVQRPSARPVKEKTVLEPSQVDAVLRDDACPLAVRLLMVTGMRPEELQALRWGSCHLDGATTYLTIDRVAYYAPGRGWTTREGAKTASSCRRVVLDATTANLLATVRDSNPDAYVVGDGETILTADRLATVVRTYFAGYSLPAMTPYALRRSCVTYLLGMGVDVKTVAQRVGHTSITTTLQAYAQVTTTAAAHAANIFS